MAKVSTATWAATMTGLTEQRDLREVQTLCLAMDLVKKKEVAQALDVIAQRIVAIQQAKKPQGKWEKAEQIELLPTGGSSLASSGMLSLLA